MKPRENMMAIFNREQPDYYGDFMAALDFAPDPVFAADSVPDDGLEHRDSWGTVCVKLPGSPGKHPHVTPENAVVKDVTAWREQLKVPALEGLDWSAAREFAAGADRSERFVGLFSAQGLFERSHFLMGMEDAFCAYLEEPEDMADMLRAIADYKIAVLREAARQFQPDVVFFQDDWGSKQNLFLPPTVWRELIKPLHAEIVAAAHECGMLFVHHADCICEPIVEDMVEMGIDIWRHTAERSPRHSGEDGRRAGHHRRHRRPGGGHRAHRRGGDQGRGAPRHRRVLPGRALLPFHPERQVLPRVERCHRERRAGEVRPAMGAGAPDFGGGAAALVAPCPFSGRKATAAVPEGTAAVVRLGVRHAECPAGSRDAPT